MPRAVLAAPLYNGADHLDEALASLLGQTYEDFALVLVDDASTDRTAEIARGWAARDARISVEVNAVRLGMLRNTNRAWALAAERHPEAEFRALASDHDVWEPRWLEALVAALDRTPDAVLAWPVTRRITAGGHPVGGLIPGRCDTTGVRRRHSRVLRAHRRMVAGDMIYGLVRARALDRVGGYRAVLVPDRLLLSELALLGSFVQVDELLWSRRFVGLADLDRQRQAFWPEGAPRSARLPWWLTHVGVALTRRGPVFAADLLVAGVRLRAVRRAQQARRRLGRALERPTRVALRLAPFRAAVSGRRLPVPAGTQLVLERLLAEREAQAPRR